MIDLKLCLLDKYNKHNFATVEFIKYEYFKKL